MNNQINSKHRLKHDLSSFCLLANDCFSFWHKQIWTKYRNIVTVEASVWVLYVGIWRYLCNLGWIWENDKQICWYVNAIKKKKKKNLSSLAKSGPGILKSLQPIFLRPNGYISRPHTTTYAIFRIVNKTSRQNTFLVKHPWQNTPGMQL